MTYDLYEASQTAGEEGSFHLFEKYEGPAALEAHRASEHYKHYRAAIGSHLAEPIAVQVLSAVDAKA